MLPGHSLSVSPPRVTASSGVSGSALFLSLCVAGGDDGTLFSANAAKSLLWGIAGLDPGEAGEERPGRRLVDVSAVCWGKVSFGGAALLGVMDVCSNES